MAVTHGHGNPYWTRDEVILALDLYFDCKGVIPEQTDQRVQMLSTFLRSLPLNVAAATKESFRNADGVVFKLLNLRTLDTGKGLGNVSKVDRAVWEELGHDPVRTKRLANLIRSALDVLQEQDEGATEDEDFAEGSVVTQAHARRERSARLRKLLLERMRKAGNLRCEICACTSAEFPPHLGESVFEAHHVIPLGIGEERKTKVKDLSLLCANCHRMVHRAIARNKRWLSVEEARAEILAIARNS